jgi:hypothetical protein
MLMDLLVYIANIKRNPIPPKKYKINYKTIKCEKEIPNLQ